MELEVGKDYHVIVINIVKSGAIVRLDDGSTALIHISRISDKFVSEIRDFVQIRGEYVARGVPGAARPVELSLQHLDLRPGQEKQVTPSKQTSNTRVKPKCASVRKGPPPAIDEIFPTRVANGQSLDDMISASTKSFKDKVKRDSTHQHPSKRRRPR